MTLSAILPLPLGNAIIVSGSGQKTISMRRVPIVGGVGFDLQRH
jgi:hypothetical protein